MRRSLPLLAAALLVAVAARATASRLAPAPPVLWPAPRLGRTDAPRRFRAVAVQPKWRATDYVTPARFRAWLRAQLLAARPHLDPTRPNLVVLTELNGMPLALQGAPLAARMPSLQLGLGLVLLKHLPAALLHAARHRVSVVRGLLLAQAPGTTAQYLRTCADLAREFGVYLACGTGTLPHLRLQGNRVVVDGPGVYNTAPIFDPNGDLIGLTDKVYLTPDEEAGGLDLTPGQLADLRVFPTPVGDLAVATSLDAFKTDFIAHAEAHGATVLLQPDANASEWTAREGLPPDPQHLRDQPEAWLDSSWRAVQRAITLRYAINPMVVGNLLGVPFDGQSAIVARPAETPDERSYVMTDPRPGFLALAPWVATGAPEALREMGRRLAPGRGDPLQNAYLETVISADLTLPASRIPAPEASATEAAVRAWLEGRATLDVDAWTRALSIAWPLAFVGLAASGLRRPARRWPALLLGLLGAVLTLR